MNKIILLGLITSLHSCAGNFSTRQKGSKAVITKKNNDVDKKKSKKPVILGGIDPSIVRGILIKAVVPET